MSESRSVNKVILIGHPGRFQITIAHAGGNTIKTVYSRNAADEYAKLGRHVRVKDLTSDQPPATRRQKLAA